MYTLNLMFSYGVNRKMSYEGCLLLYCIFLFLLTLFSIEYYGTLHNIFAVSFFIVNIYPLYKLKRYRKFLIPYLLSCVFLPNLFWFEVSAITVLCVYHLNLLLKVRKVLKGD